MDRDLQVDDPAPQGADELLVIGDDGDGFGFGHGFPH
jgi:hypothetical protein